MEMLYEIFQSIRKPLYCLIAGVSFYVCPASAQLGTIVNVGATVTEMDAITFNSSGVLYGATGGAGALYIINQATGAATLVHAFVGASNASLTYGVNGLAFQPAWHGDPLWHHQPGLAEFGQQPRQH